MAALFFNIFGILFVPFIAAMSLEPKVINGTEALFNNTRHQVSVRMWRIEYVYGSGHICGGSLIAPKVVLSAAHCFYNDQADNGTFYKASDYFVVMGSLNRYEIDNNTVILNITKMVFPDFDRPTFKNDAVLIFLNDTVPLSNPGVSVIEMNRKEVPVGTVCQLTGWGVTETGDDSLILKTVDVPIIDNETCSTNYPNNTILDGMICAGYMEGQKDACQGDSGGPLVCNGKLAGIVSFGDDCAKPGYPGIHTNVSYHAKWIDETIKANTASVSDLSNVVILLVCFFICFLKINPYLDIA